MSEVRNEDSHSNSDIAQTWIMECIFGKCAFQLEVVNVVMGHHSLANLQLSRPTAALPSAGVVKSVPSTGLFVILYVREGGTPRVEFSIRGGSGCGRIKGGVAYFDFGLRQIFFSFYLPFLYRCFGGFNLWSAIGIAYWRWMQWWWGEVDKGV